MEDIDLNLEDFVARVNSDLVGKYVNIASRASSFLLKHFDGELAQAASEEAPAAAAAQTVREVSEAYERREYSRAIRAAMAYADKVNQYVDSNKPWDLAKRPEARERLQRVCSEAICAFYA